MGAFDVQKSLLDGTVGEIEPIFYGEVKYPKRIHKYYINWVVFYNNVFVLDITDKLLNKIPPLRWFLGTRAKFVKSPKISINSTNIVNSVYYFFVVMLQLMILIEGMFFIGIIVWSFKQKVINKEQ